MAAGCAVPTAAEERKVDIGLPGILGASVGKGSFRCKKSLRL